MVWHQPRGWYDKLAAPYSLARGRRRQDQVCLGRVRPKRPHTHPSIRLIQRSGYTTPDDYAGNATIHQISHTVTDSYFEIVYLCQRCCWIWNQKGAEGSQIPSEVQVIGWAQHNQTYSGAWVFHTKGHSQFGISVADARNARYAEWVKLIPGTPPGTLSPTPSRQPSAISTPTTSSKWIGSPAPTEAYDYIVVGGGAGGIPVADKLSESGKKVLLIEKGPPSLARFGGTMGPTWVTSNNLTRFDVPGLCNQIWANSAGVACTDITVVKNSAADGATYIHESSWIHLPVGQNLNDHVNTDIVIRHPNISFYDFYAAWDEPIEADKKLYLSKRSGVLAQSAPNIGPVAWEAIKGSDGIDRSLQWTARAEGPGANDTHHLTMSQANISAMAPHLEVLFLSMALSACLLAKHPISRTRRTPTL